MIGAHIVIRPTTVQDTWLSGARARLDEIGRANGAVILAPRLNREAEKEIPHEAICRLCCHLEQAPPLAPGETEAMWTARMREEGFAIGPVPLANAMRWAQLHLRAKHGIDGIDVAYEVESGTERWLA